MPVNDWSSSFSQIEAHTSVSPTALSQISQAVATHACSAAHVRNRDGIPGSDDFYDFVNDDNLFEDSTFATNDAIYWQDDGEYALSYTKYVVDFCETATEAQKADIEQIVTQECAKINI